MLCINSCSQEVTLHVCRFSYPPWGTADAETKVRSAENPELSRVLSCLSGNSGLARSIASDVSLIAEDSAFVIVVFSVHPPPCLSCVTCNVNTESDFTFDWLIYARP